MGIEDQLQAGTQELGEARRGLPAAGKGVVSQDGGWRTWSMT